MIGPEELRTFKTAIESAKTVFITAHVGPDGDTLGSMLGLMHTFKRYFPHLEKVDCVISGKMPDVFNFMPGIEAVQDVDVATNLLQQYDLAFCVDCGSADRLGPSKQYFMDAKQSINIDHHISNTRFGKINLIVVDASASGEVIADLLIGNNIPITPETATCLYVACMTDTGGFKYSNTTSKIFELMARLTQNGANPEEIYRHVYEELPKPQALLHAEALLSAKFNAEETLCWIVVTRALMEKYNATEEHVEGLVETLRRIDTVLVSAILRETKSGLTKVSLRSDVPYINVADIMARWNGGGHKMAAGCTIEKPPFEAEKDLLPLLEETLRNAHPVPAS